MRLTSSPLRGALSLFVLAAALLNPCAGGGGALVRAQTYAVTPIADTNASSSPFSSFFAFPSLNAGGTVAFQGNGRAGGSGLYKGDGSGALTTVADTSASGAFSGFSSSPDINAAGTVAFRGVFRAGGTGIVTGSGGATTTLYDSTDPTGPFASFSGFPVLNDAGAVAFYASRRPAPTTGAGVYVGDGSAPATAVATAGPSSFLGNPVLNNAGALAFGAAVGASDFGLYATGPNAANLGLIVDTTGAFSDFGDPALNDLGALAFRANLDAGGQQIVGYQSGVRTALYAATAGGLFAGFGGVALNNAGEVAFRGNLSAGGFGLFVGDSGGGTPRKVIASGDALAGSTVTGLTFFGGGFNDAGQVAFVASLADGRNGVFRAGLTPPSAIPEPGTLALALLPLLLLVFSKGNFRMNCRLFVAALAAGLWMAAAPSWAQTTALTDNNASVQITAGGVVTVFRVNNGPDNVFRSEYFFRVGAVAEQLLGTNATTTTTLTGTNRRDTTYAANDGSFRADVRYLLQGGVGGNAAAARLFETVSVTNTSSAALPFSLFSYSDYDLNFNPTLNDDQAVAFSNTGIFQSDPFAALLTTSDVPFDFYEIDYGIPPSGPIFPIRAKLTDNQPTTLTNTPAFGAAFPAGAFGADVAFAQQWNPTIAPGATFSVTTTRNLTTAIPEPGTLALLGITLLPGAAAALLRRRRHQQAALGAALIAGTLACCATAARAQAPRFTLTDLGTLGGLSSQARGLNELGQVVGSATLASGATHAFFR